MKRWLVRILLILGSLIGLILVAVVALNLVSMSRQRRTYDIPTSSLVIPSDSASIARGEHLVRSVSVCMDCHGKDLGGQKVIESPPMGRLWATNLTAGTGGIGKSYSVADWERSIRHGVGPDRRSLVFMPSEAYQSLSDADLAAIIAFIQKQPPVDRVRPATQVGPLARMLHVAVGFPLLSAAIVDHGMKPAHVTAGRTLEYGAYLAGASGCRACHGAELAGTGNPACPNITRGVIGQWSESDFTRVLQEGKRPDGTTLTDEMPWKSFASMSDDEIGALWLYQQSVVAVAPKQK